MKPGELISAKTIPWPRLRSGGHVNTGHDFLLPFVFFNDAAFGARIMLAGEPVAENRVVIHVHVSGTQYHRLLAKTGAVVRPGQSSSTDIK